MFTKIIQLSKKIAANPQAVFIIGSFVYSPSKAKDIDIVIIPGKSEKKFGYKKFKMDKKIIKFSILPEHSVQDDLRKELYGGFIIDRFLNPLIPLQGEKIIKKYQKLIINKEITEFLQIYHKSKISAQEFLDGIILHHAFIFPSYLKQFVVIRKYAKNQYVKEFVNLFKFKNRTFYFCKKFYPNFRVGKILYNYWNTRGAIQGRKFIKWDDVYKRGTTLNISKFYWKEISLAIKKIFS